MPEALFVKLITVNHVVLMDCFPTCDGKNQERLRAMSEVSRSPWDSSAVQIVDRLQGIYIL